MKNPIAFFLALNFCAFSVSAETQFREYPIGDPVEINGLTVAAVYFPAVSMDHTAMMPAGMHSKHTGMKKGHAMSHQNVSDAEIQKEKFAPLGKELIHMEADIHALKENPSGFGAGEWIPYLEIHFSLFENGKEKPVLSGSFMPMIAKDGPHYGTTIRMPGKGKYRLEYEISPPALARHSDPTTGVAEYWKSFKVSYDFEYAGIAKTTSQK